MITIPYNCIEACYMANTIPTILWVILMTCQKNTGGLSSRS